LRRLLHTKFSFIQLVLLSLALLIGCSRGAYAPIAEKPADSFHLFKSLDHGESWTKVGSGLPQSRRINSLLVTGVAAYAGTDAGVYISTDDGRTWSESHLSSTARIQCLLAVGQQVFAGTRSAGVFVSKDNGRSWRPLAGGLTDLNVRSLANLGPEIYAGTDEQRVFVLARGAESWDRFGRGLPERSQVFDLAVDGLSVYAALYSKGLYRLNSGGENWTKVGDVTPLEFLVQDGALLAGLNPGGVFRSIDGGATWTLSRGISSEAPIWTLGSSSSNLLAGTSPGAVWRSSDLGASWRPSAAGLPSGAAVIAIGSNNSYMLAAVSK
jgi:photosystem II stability/assembly factor-like uncharacterized protein